VYFRFNDGLLPAIALNFNRKFQTFRPKYGYIAGLVKQGRFIDQRGLSRLSRADFQRAAAELQQRWTDSVIAVAAHRLPPPVYALEGEKLMSTLKARRATLPQAADTYYLDLFSKAVVGGTTQPERLLVDRYADSTVVRLETTASGPQKKPLVYYQRTFPRNETKSITLEALGGDDTFVVNTHPGGRPMPLHLYGGEGKDAVQLTGPKGRLKYYDNKADGDNGPLPVRTPKRKRLRYDRLDKAKN
jgi:hypothetical protein